MTITEQIQNWCRHFTGISNKTCKIGLNYDDVKDSTTSPFKWPCFASGLMSGGTCGSCSFPTKEEAQAKAHEMESKSNVAILAYIEIQKQKGDSGTIECPKCKGELHWAKANNKHIRAKCGCGLNFMQ